ncbi:hypothetical protein RND71_040238 [Anisodus tanguticus]|uniref:Uncharacterized protein n=1 Tax=Anisodus tanguticus TaxID=243964 RepID=A0AAE1QT05_9SOLA|nr:hypothetical protein RND71_040238 [Anisodus tanguticus]
MILKLLPVKNRIHRDGLNVGCCFELPTRRGRITARIAIASYQPVIDPATGDNETESEESNDEDHEDDIHNSSSKAKVMMMTEKNLSLRRRILLIKQ